MGGLIYKITSLLDDFGFEHSIQMRNDHEVICSRTLDGHDERIILPLEIRAQSSEEAIMQATEAEDAIRMINSQDGEYPLIITQDRWNTQGDMMQKRLLAHLELFTPIYARNCEIRRIDKIVAKDFLNSNHSYGHASCRYCYGLFLKRHTGFMAGSVSISPGTLVAVATFSNARKWSKESKTILSYEWTRYASLPEVRLNGGMGKMLKHFIEEVGPDDIMSYADLEWSKGDVYMRLGFRKEGKKEAVLFAVDDNWVRIPAKKVIPDGTDADYRYFQNFGSNKFRLKLTDYQ